MTRFPGMVAFVAVATACTAALPVASGPGRHALFLLVSLLDVAVVIRLVRRAPRGDRNPFVLLALGTIWLVPNALIGWFGGESLVVLADVVLAVANLHLLAAAVALVLRRGRNDVGGLLDAGVIATVIAALIWTLLLQPGLDAAGVALSAQASLLATVLLLSGVLGTMVRVIRTSRHRPAPLILLAAAILADLAATVAAIAATGTVTIQSSVLIDMVFMVSYSLLGLAALHPGTALMARPGPVPPDRLFAGRVVLLTAAVTVVPTVSGVREILGVHGDAALLTVGNLLIVGLVAFRIARLGRQREAAELLLRHQATHDLLTGLPNRADLWNRLDDALTREQRSGEPSVVLLFCDLNGFKQVNDRLGHLAGDLLLTEVAGRLRIAGAFTARYGGDEFVLLCEDPDQVSAADRLSAHVHAALAPPVPLAGEDVRVGVSVGAVLSDGHLDADELIRRADQAMYRDKATRRAA
ncbi:GGDEF domain-containing protein [Actinoplanes sp. NEAU-A12]|uniref:GGDEF domain-containing protein n=1 Tax=Actinoplanes sandaracinus TaxID=3045177 RepID=A0ABT6WR90_9ACTN|nr:GGDEF domain-containing protein [Actinoplanes sandaracinus]MDI6102256.1 GGDEF domain-containing protein [Actinoplanes sandaracinus]